MRSVHKISTIARAYFEVYDTLNAPVTGLINADFTKLLALDGVDNATAVTVTEIGSGRYFASFTPGSTGSWHLLIRQATYNLRGWHETFDVTTDGILTIADIQTGLATAAAVAAIQSDTDNIQTRLPTALVSGKMDSTLSSSERDAIAAALLDLASTVDGNTLRNTLKYMAAALAGKVSGMETGSPIFRSINDTADRISATCDIDGNRTAVTLTP